MPGRENIEALKREYREKKPRIVKRLAEFRQAYDRGDRVIFEELCYCIFTAGSSARMGMRTVDALRDLLQEGTLAELQERARAHRVRFWSVRPSYVVQTRECLRRECKPGLREFIDSFASAEARRDFFASHKEIKGLGYKEASHFLRNIGFRGYAILDKHILKALQEFGLLGENVKPPFNRTAYLAIEKKMAGFAREIGINMDHLDLLLWSRQTGEILK